MFYSGLSISLQLRSLSRGSLPRRGLYPRGVGNLPVLSLGYVILTVRITDAFGLPKLSLFCNVQRDVASLSSYSKTEFKFKSHDTYLVADWLLIIMQYHYLIYWCEHILHWKYSVSFETRHRSPLIVCRLSLYDEGMKYPQD